MQRDLGQLAHNQFDVLVIGGGIYGISIARDAVLRGLKVCLVEAGDFGSGTSHNSLKIIHGGIRYFQHLNFKRVYESVREREMWVQVSQHLIRPLKVVLPCYGRGSRGPLALGSAVKMHNLVATIQKGKHRAFPNGHLISKVECNQLLPELDDQNISGGAVWYDGQIVDADRLHIELLKDACRRGLCLANYLPAEEILIASNKAIGASVRDIMTGRAFDIQASFVVNATGPWAYSLLESSLKNTTYKYQPLTKNFNIVVDDIGKDFAFGVKSTRTSDAVLGSSKRVYFFTPWLNKTVIGTAHFEHNVDKPIDSDVLEFLPGFIAEINEAYPSLNLKQNDIRYIYSGYTPAEPSNSSNEFSRSHHTNIIDHTHIDGVGNLLSVVGVKYTTARSSGEQVVDMVVKRLAKKVRDLSFSKKHPASYAIEAEKSKYSRIDELNFQSSISAEDIDSIYRKHIKEHVTHIVDTEMVLTLEDYVLRRNNLTLRGLLHNQDIDHIAKILAKIFSWQDHEIQKQLASVAKKLSYLT